jgi:hypothetical protein
MIKKRRNFIIIGNTFSKNSYTLAKIKTINNAANVLYVFLVSNKTLISASFLEALYNLSNLHIP